MQLLWQAELQIAPLRIFHLRLLLFMLCISILIFIPLHPLAQRRKKVCINQMNFYCKQSHTKNRTQLIAEFQMYVFRYIFSNHFALINCCELSINQGHQMFPRLEQFLRI